MAKIKIIMRDFWNLFRFRSSPTEVFLRARILEICSNLQKNTRDLNKVALQIYWNHTSEWVFFCKLLHIFRTPALTISSGGLAASVIFFWTLIFVLQFKADICFWEFFIHRVLFSIFIHDRRTNYHYSQSKKYSD